ncbi:hypothetical protein KM043_013984 [Ampulex compressa]|nr:hypothetical protein KM043_013984 [Ampulex compressa]
MGVPPGSGEPLEDEEIITVFLVSLRESYSRLVTVFEDRDKRDLTVEYVTRKILNEYQRRIEASATNESSGSYSDMAFKSAASSGKKVLLAPTTEIKLPATPTTQYIELEGPEDKCSEETSDNESDEELPTPPPAP